MGENKIAEELAAKFGVDHSPSTIRNYMIPRSNGPRRQQTWRTFIRNHGKAVSSCDFLTQRTAFFAVAYIFAIMEIGSRRIVHVNVTSNPTIPWVNQQIREASDDDVAPRLLVHDNDGIFGQCRKAVTSEENSRRRSYRCHLDRWLDKVIGIEGLPTAERDACVNALPASAINLKIGPLEPSAEPGGLSLRSPHAAHILSISIC